MRKILAAILLVIVVAACDTSGHPNRGKPAVSKAGVPFRVYKATIEGHRCYYTHAFVHGEDNDDTHVYSLTCDWRDR